MLRHPTFRRPIPPAPAEQRARGADFSSYQTLPVTEAAIAQDGGLQFGIVKLTEGLRYVNPLYRQQVQALRNHGALVGAYHFLSPSDGARQWDHFESVLGFTGVRLVAADYEAKGVTDQVARAFIRRGHQRGYKVGLYASRSVVTRKLGQDWTWAAWWNPAPPPFAWDIWQFAAGQDGAPDWNVYRGTLEQLHTFAARVAAAPQVGPGNGGGGVYLQPRPRAWWIHDEQAGTALGPFPLPVALTRLTAYALGHPRSGRYSLERK